MSTKAWRNSSLHGHFSVLSIELRWLSSWRGGLQSVSVWGLDTLPPLILNQGACYFHNPPSVDHRIWCAGHWDVNLRETALEPLRVHYSVKCQRLLLIRGPVAARKPHRLSSYCLTLPSISPSPSHMDILSVWARPCSLQFLLRFPSCSCYANPQYVPYRTTRGRLHIMIRCGEIFAGATYTGFVSSLWSVSAHTPRLGCSKWRAAKPENDQHVDPGVPPETERPTARPTNNSGGVAHNDNRHQLFG